MFAGRSGNSAIKTTFYFDFNAVSLKFYRFDNLDISYQGGIAWFASDTPLFQ